MTEKILKILLKYNKLKFIRRGLPVAVLMWGLCACAASPETNVNWGNADYAQIICASPNAGCKSAGERE